MEIIDALKWRYATKRFDPSRKVSESDLKKLMEAVNLSASSFGLQAYRVWVIGDREVKEKLCKASYDQPQLTESSHTFVFAAKTRVEPAYVDDYMRRIAAIREQPLEKVQGFGEYIKSTLVDKPDEYVLNWNKRQAYMGLSTLLAAAAELRIDNCPMEGFEPEKYDKILGLKEHGLTATVIASVGYRSEEDATRNHKKVRLPLDEMFTVV